MPTDDNDAYGDLDKSNPKFIYGQFLIGKSQRGKELQGCIDVQPCSGRREAISPRQRLRDCRNSFSPVPYGFCRGFCIRRRGRW